jgi:MoaA/NifB/PqqE/SkfB family radical SAM enzyme
MADKIACYYALGGLNYKNGFITCCPQTPAQLHLMEQSILPSEIINSKGFREHRQELMNGNWPSSCHLCQEVENAGAGKSMRQGPQRDDVENYYDHTDGSIAFKGLKHVELRFSNSCNMACLHCSDVYSSGWMSKLKHYEPDADDRKHKLIQLTREMHRKSPDEDLSIGMSIEEMERVVDDLNTNFPNIEKIEFAGGEVLYQKQFLPCLKRLANHPNAKNIAIAFHTNFNAKFKPEELSKLLEPFGKSIIQISLDAGTNIYSYFRSGDWNIMVDHLTKFKAINDFSEIAVISTTSAYQIMDIENIFESFLSLDVEFLESAIVYTPWYMNPAIMMFNFKNEVLGDIANTYKIIESERQKRMDNLGDYTHLRSWRPHNKEFEDIRTALKALKNIEDYVTNARVDYTDWEAFQVYIRKTDAIWKQNFNDYMKKYKFVDGEIKRVP